MQVYWKYSFGSGLQLSSTERAGAKETEKKRARAR